MMDISAIGPKECRTLGRPSISVQVSAIVRVFDNLSRYVALVTAVTLL